MSKWLPAVEAPRDGRHFLAACFDESAGFGWFRGKLVSVQTVVHWYPGHEDDAAGFYTSVNEVAPKHPFSFTHWKDLEPLE